MSDKRLPLVCLLTLLLAVACSDYPEADFYEVNGVVSIRANSLEERDGWKAAPYFTGTPMVSVEDTLGAGGSLTFSFFVRRPGSYHIWVLTKQASEIPEENFLPIRVMDNRNFLVDHFRLGLNERNALEWLNEEAGTAEELVADFPEPGHYSVVFESQGRSGYVIDKLHLALNNVYKPSGLGYPETRDYRADPVLAKREQIVVIPPAWAFGVMAGGATSQAAAERQVDYFQEHDIPLDAYWITPDWDEKKRMTGHSAADMYQNNERFAGIAAFPEAMSTRGISPGLSLSGNPQTAYENLDQLQSFLEDGFLFVKFNNSADTDAIKPLFNAIRQAGPPGGRRGFVLADAGFVRDPDFKQYPSIYGGASVPEWSQPSFPDFENRTMGGLKEQIEMAANRRLATYGIPFLSTGVGGYPTGRNEFSEELFIRWVQFGAFHSMMHIAAAGYPGGSIPFVLLSEDGIMIVRNYLHLRNRLFPYIYSLAHLIRPTGVKPVRGDGERTTQFYLGNSLLVAPVYEQDTPAREVYLPEGTWYGYWGGIVYEGGQYYEVSTSIEEIPVFVKAGSIIPYREGALSIQSGSNQKLTVEIYGGDRGTFRLYEDDGITTRYQQGEFSTTAFRYFEGDGYSSFTIGQVVREYSGQPDEKELLLSFKYVEEPVSVTANGEHLERGEAMNQWSYDEDTRTLQIHWVQPNILKTDFLIRK